MDDEGRELARDGKFDRDVRRKAREGDTGIERTRYRKPVFIHPKLTGCQDREVLHRPLVPKRSRVPGGVELDHNQGRRRRDVLPGRVDVASFKMGNVQGEHDRRAVERREGGKVQGGAVQAQAVPGVREVLRDKRLMAPRLCRVRGVRQLRKGYKLQRLILTRGSDGAAGRARSAASGAPASGASRSPAPGAGPGAEGGRGHLQSKQQAGICSPHNSDTCSHCLRQARTDKRPGAFRARRILLLFGNQGNPKQPPRRAAAPWDIGLPDA